MANKTSPNDRIPPSAEPQIPVLLKAADVAKILNVSIPMAYALIESRDIPGIYIGRCVRVRLDDLMNYINRPEARVSTYAG